MSAKLKIRNKRCQNELRMKKVNMDFCLNDIQQQWNEHRGICSTLRNACFANRRTKNKFGWQICFVELTTVVFHWAKLYTDILPLSAFSQKTFHIPRIHLRQANIKLWTNGTSIKQYVKCDRFQIFSFLFQRHFSLIKWYIIILKKYRRKLIINRHNYCLLLAILYIF